MRPARADVDARKTLLGFLLAEVHYALDICRVVQVLRPLPMTPLPPLPEGLVGVVEHRNDVIPVIDLRLCFGLPLQPATRQTRWILVDLGSQPLAIIVDGVTRVFGTAPHALRPAPGLAGDVHRGVLGVTSYEGRLTFVLDVDRLRRAVASLPPPPSSRQSAPSFKPRSSLPGPRS